MVKRKIRSGKQPDYIIFSVTFALIVFGLLMLASASSNLAKAKFGDSYYFLKHQIFYSVFGIIGFWIASKFYYQYFRKLALLLLILNIIGLILIFTPLGFSSGGAERWLKIGSLTFQPSEFLKISFIIYVAAWLGSNEKRKNNFWLGFLPFLIIGGTISALLILQPSTSMMAVLMASVLIIYFISGARLTYIIGAIIIFLAVFLLLSFFTNYRLERLINFLNQQANPQTSGYHLNQALIAIGSGGLTGVGYGQSTTKIRYLPEPMGDSIFAVIAEELGFIGGVLVIAAYLILIIRALVLSRKTTDNFAKLLLVGFSSVIGIQVFINIGAMSGLIPLTGAPLPYISYGGTALLVYMIISGIMVNISKYV